MKPRTQLQKQVVAASMSLPAITEKQEQWAKDNCFKDEAYLCKKTVWCLHCNKTFHREENIGLALSFGLDEAVCPHCGRLLKLKQSKKRKVDEKMYYTILTTHKGFQVCRHFIVRREMRMGRGDVFFDIAEAVQNWISVDGKEVIMARSTKMNYFCYDVWNFDTPLNLKEVHRSYRPNKYDIEAYFIYPYRKILPIIKRNGYKGDIQGISSSELFKMLLSSRQAEELIKTKQHDCLLFSYKRGRLPNYIMDAIHICVRNGYRIKDASMYCDYIELLRYFGKDIHNAHYVCPKNLKKEHDRWSDKKMVIEQEKRLEEEQKEISRLEEGYKDAKGKYFGICFGNNDIVITVVQSVAEMYEEGKAMHHCVYSNRYYAKANSLILTAKDKDGNRIETIEVNLETFKVVQSRGTCNKNTPKHNDIVKLVTDNMNLIQKAKRAV